MSLTKKEKIILENTDEKYKYIARDKCGLLILYIDRPKKHRGVWWLSDNFEFTFSAFDHLFKDIKWEDKEPLQFRNDKGEFIL